MADDHTESKSHKHKRPSKDDKASSLRPTKAGGKNDVAAQTARQMKLIQKWGGIVQSLREADQLSPEDGIKQFDEAIEKLEEVKRDKEKVYLLEDGLPEMIMVVLDSRYIVDTFHKKITEFVQKVVTFALEGFEYSISGSCKLIYEIFGHTHFSEIASQGLGAVEEGQSQITSSREFLTQSKRIKTYGRLNEVIATFCDQHGWSQILSTLSKPQLSLDDTRSLLQVIVIMTSYLNASPATLIQFAREGTSRLVKKALDVSPHESVIYLEIKDLIRQLIESMNPAEIGLLPEIWRLPLVVKFSRELPISLPILWMHYPERSCRLVQLDPTKLQVVKDAHSEFCKQADLEMDEVVLKSVVNGVVIKNHDDTHSITTMYVQTSHNVAYQMPIGWKRKYVQVLVTERKPRAAGDFIPFYVFLRRKDVHGKHFYESVIPSSYLFTVKSMTEPPFTLKAVNGATVVDVANSTARIFPELAKGDSITISIDWAETSESTSMHTNEILNSKQAFAKGELLETLRMLAPQTSALRSLLAKAQHAAEKNGGPSSDLPIELQPVTKSKKSGKRKSGERKLKHDTFNEPNSKRGSSSQAEDETLSVAATFNQFFEALVSLLGYCDLDICKVALQLFHGFSSDTSMRDLLAIYSPIPKLAKNLSSPSVEVRQWSSQTLTFFGHDTFFYQRPTEMFESFDVRKMAPTHLNHRDSEVLQFLYQVNSLRTVDPEFIDHATTEQLFWLLPLAFQTLQGSRISKEGEHAIATLRATMDLLLQKLQPLSYLRQFTLWLKYSCLIEEKEFDLEWAIGARFESTRSFFASLASTMPNIEIGKKFTGIDIMDPMHDADGHNLPISAVTVLKVFSSKAKPCLLELFPVDSKYPSKRVIFKKGDDLRQDLLVQACFYLFNVLWSHSDITEKPFIHQYRLIPMGPDTGCVEFVADSESLQTFSFEKAWPKYTEEDKSTLLRSAAGSYVAGWVMGVRDRHQDNMMVQHGNMFFHIDLGHIFNEKPTIDAPRFSIPTDMKEAMSNQEWDRFKDLCANVSKFFIDMLVCSSTSFASCSEALLTICRKLDFSSLLLNHSWSDSTKGKPPTRSATLLIQALLQSKRRANTSSTPSLLAPTQKPSSAGPLSSANIKSSPDSDAMGSDEAFSEPSVSPRKYSISQSDTEGGALSPRESEDKPSSSSLAPPKRNSKSGSSPRNSVSGDADRVREVVNSAPI